MRTAVLLILVSAVLAAQVTPVQKVTQLLNGMVEKGKKERHQEQVQFAAYKQFCQDTSAEKQASIKEANRDIESLDAAIQKHDSNAKRLAKAVAGLEVDISTWTGDMSAAKKVRSMEHSDYQATAKDYSESIDALQRAVAVLKKQSHDRKQVDALLQVQSLELVPQSTKKIIDNFLQASAPTGLDVSAPEANAYEFQSSSVIEMLEKLNDKFGDEKYSLEKEEKNSKHAFQLLIQDLEAQVATAEDDKAAKETSRANNQQAAAAARGDLSDTTSTRDDDTTYLNDLVATCQMKSDDFGSRQQLRAEEIEAIEKAIEILTSSSVAGHADTYLPKDATSFLQMSASAEAPLKTRAVAFLTTQAQKLHSRLLSTLAERATSDPFKDVKKMINDLLVRLQEEANEEASHKGWCDKELSTNEQTRNEKTASVEALHAEVDQLEATIAKLTKQIAELTEAVQELDTAMAKATEIRNQERATNKQTVTDAVEAQSAVANALVVLREFYQKAGKATALIQQQPEAPAIFSSPYTGMQSENGGVIGMLEVIQSDFARLETETKTAEESAQASYDKFASDTTIDKASKTKDIEHKTNKNINKKNDLQNRNTDLQQTQKELDAALRYFDKLKPSCIDAGVSFEDRVQRRKEEIESLQEALRILNGEELA